MKNPHAVAMGCKGGKARSEAKVAASRVNASKATASRVAKQAISQSVRDAVTVVIAYPLEFSDCDLFTMRSFIDREMSRRSSDLKREEQV